LKVLKKVIALILLFFILFVNNGYYLYFKYLQYSIRLEVRREIENGRQNENLSLIIISFANNEKINWTEKGREFKYKGAMYDVVKTQIENGIKYYYCFNDVKEKNLISKFLTGGKKKKRHLLFFQKVLNNKYLAGRISTPNNKLKHANPFSLYMSFYNSLIIGNISHPPQSDFSFKYYI
jgi:hypothetical protein